MREVVFDVETKKLFSEVEGKDPEKLGVSIISVYKRDIKDGIEIHGQMQSFWENEIMDAWHIFEEADRIIGFNSLKFDVLALKPYFPQKILKLNHFDILDKIRSIMGRRISLDSLASCTLGKSKTDVGVDAVNYYNRGDEVSLQKLKHYCESDVLITRDLYDYGQKNKHLRYFDLWNVPRMVNVDFSYPVGEIAQTKQVGLF